MATSAPLQPAAPQRGIKALLARHPLVSFFGMAYAFSWIVWAPWVLGEDGANVLPPALSVPTSRLLLTGGILAGPTLSAFIMTATTEGREGVRRLLGRLVLWRVGLRWYLFSLLGVPLIMVVGTMIYSGELPNLGALGGPSYLLSYLGLYVFVMVLGGPLFEEIGWRGFALPRMEPLQGPIVASVILGVLWALWHLPEFLVPSWAASSGGGGILGITLFTLTAITFTIVITWVFNNTRASVLLAILVHLIGDHVPAVKDIVSCGGGFDRVVADTKDVVAEDCEKVLVVHGSKKEVLKQEDAFFKSLPPATRKFFDTFFEEQLAPFPNG